MAALASANIHYKNDNTSRTTASAATNSDKGKEVGQIGSNKNASEKLERGMARTCDLLRVTESSVKET